MQKNYKAVEFSFFFFFLGGGGGGVVGGGCMRYWETKSGILSN